MKSEIIFNKTLYTSVGEMLIEVKQFDTDWFSVNYEGRWGNIQITAECPNGYGQFEILMYRIVHINILNKIKSMVHKYPNDLQLGAEIRKYLN